VLVEARSFVGDFSLMRTKLAVLGAVAVLLAPFAARADESIIKNPDDHPLYRFEAEPHGLLGFGGPFEHGNARLGAGFRGTIIIVDNGFVKSINNSVGIGFGADLFFDHGVLYIPVVMQWNFWLTTHWSVFGEPGIGIAANPEANRDVLGPVLMVGGRYHFNDRISLTMRIGYPAISVGVSFFL
jgi:hypothetical protein